MVTKTRSLVSHIHMVLCVSEFSEEHERFLDVGKVTAMTLRSARKHSAL